MLFCEMLMQVRLLILPNLKPYVKLLEPELLLEQQKNKMKRYEAWRVYGALLVSFPFLQPSSTVDPMAVI